MCHQCGTCIIGINALPKSYTNVCRTGKMHAVQNAGKKRGNLYMSGKCGFRWVHVWGSGVYDWDSRAVLMLIRLQQCVGDLSVSCLLEEVVYL